jgi:hypothetical protein
MYPKSAKNTKKEVNFFTGHPVCQTQARKQEYALLFREKITTLYPFMVMCKNKMNNFAQLAPMGVFAPGSAHARPSARHPWHICLQSHLQKFPPTPHKSYPKLQNPTTTFKIVNNIFFKPKNAPPGGQGGSPNVLGGGANFIFLPTFLFLLVRSPFKNLKQQQQQQEKLRNTWNYGYLRLCQQPRAAHRLSSDQLSILFLSQIIRKKGPLKIFKIGETFVWKFCIRSKLSELWRFLPNLSTHFAPPKCLALTPSNHIMRLWENSGERG